MVNTAAAGSGQQAPAVARAMRAIERLAALDEPCSLSALSRELGIGASSLLTILAPLRDAGVVARDAAGGYTLGPALVGLGEAAARTCSAVHVFERLAGPLVDQTGETALLWSACGDGFALAAVREGRHPLRFVPPPSARLHDVQARRLAASGQGDLVEMEPLAGVWMIAAPLSSVNGTVTAAVALAGPSPRLHGEAGASARAALREALAGLLPGARTLEEAPLSSRGSSEDAARTTADWEQAGPIGRAELDEFLRQSHVATLSYVADDGYPVTVPLWYAWDGTAFWLAPRPGAEWAAHVRLDPRVSLAVSESTPPLRRVLARGRLDTVDDPDGGQARHVAADLAARYAGCGAARPGAATSSPLLRLLPERLIAWRGLLRHPRVAAESNDNDARGIADRRQLG